MVVFSSQGFLVGQFHYLLSLHIQLRFTLLSKCFLNNVCTSFVFLLPIVVFFHYYTLHRHSHQYIYVCLYILYSYQTTLTLTFAVIPMFQKRKTFTVNNISPVVKPSSLKNLIPKKEAEEERIRTLRNSAQYFLPGFSTLQKCGIVTRQSPCGWCWTCCCCCCCWCWKC